MSYKERLIHLLDRPGGRLLLGKLATGAIRWAGGDDVEILYANGLWTRRAGPFYFPDGQTFNYVYSDFNEWKQQMEQYMEQCAADTEEHWLRHYSPKEGDVIIDVGAGRGEDTLTFSRGVGASGRVIAIEAHRLSFAMLTSFCQLNRLSNVTALHLALMDKPGIVRIAECESKWMENAVEPNGQTGPEVPARTLEQVFRDQGLDGVSFLKMNIEGSERYALLGMAAVMARIAHICVACHDFRSEQGHGEQFRTRAFVERVLLDHGFRITSRVDDPRDYVRDHLFGLRP